MPLLSEERASELRKWGYAAVDAILNGAMPPPTPESPISSLTISFSPAEPESNGPTHSPTGIRYESGHDKEFVMGSNGPEWNLVEGHFDELFSTHDLNEGIYPENYAYCLAYEVA